MTDTNTTHDDNGDTEHEEHYAEGEPTPADDVLMTGDGPVIMRTGEEPISVSDRDGGGDQ